MRFCLDRREMGREFRPFSRLNQILGRILEENLNLVFMMIGGGRR